MRYQRYFDGLNALPMIVFSYFNFENAVDDRTFDEYLGIVPPVVKAQVLRFRKQQDRCNRLFGKILLKELLVNCFGQSSACLEHIHYNQFGKPFIGENIDFNISHSSQIVICAVSDEGKIGIDIEKRLDLSVHDLEHSLRPDEFNILSKFPNNVPLYDFWTQKESVLKARGTGLMMTDLKNIYLKKSKAFILENRQFDEVWHLQSINVANNYSTTLCSAEPNVKPLFIYLKHPQQLLEQHLIHG